MAIQPQMVAELPLFAGLDERQRDILCQVLVERRFKPADVIVRAGDKGWTCYVILIGEVHVVAERGDGTTEPGVLATLEVGEMFGEVSLIDGGARSATCVAGPGGVLLAELARPEFDRIFNAGNTFAYQLMDIIAGQLAHRVHQAAEVLREAAFDAETA
ncbi:MAG: cyclic nucleotide-binding domain-containing protein [bacterium]|nr:cyclic nucleotide-binding domain-containing protein [Myxococcales bacterium]MCB9540971.1 cyclic nucleotide-binding domain-containing protein [Myxococcales bacterium]MCB9552581.1 cyclic nucleotide-binding domain-containing protein [Myxococcales bacterium]